MTPPKKLAAALLLLALTMAPELIWAGAHFLLHHGHSREPAGGRHPPAVLADLAEILVHGHRHPDGVPEHDHHLLPSSPARQEAPLLVAISGRGAAQAPSAEPPRGSKFASAWKPPRLVGPSPPLLHSLCTLLI